jgi:hypothetical protein
MSRSALSLLALGLVACQPARDGVPSLDTSALQGAMPAGGTVGAVFTSPGARPGDEVDPYIDETFIQLLEVATASVRVAVDRLDHPGMQEAILEAWDRGLDVQVVADADNDKYSGFDLLEGAGVPVIWQPAGAPEMHNKYVIVDEAVVWTGSLSMTTTDLLYNNHASIVLADEALAAVYRSDFDQMFVEGRFGVAKAPLGGEIELWFGKEPGVTVKREVVSKKASESGVFSKSKGVDREYRVSLTNTLARPVEVELWDRVPVSRNEQVKVELTAIAPALATDAKYLKEERPQGLLKWMLPLPARVAGKEAAPVTISWKTRVVWPDGRYLSGDAD